MLVFLIPIKPLKHVKNKKIFKSLLDSTITACLRVPDSTTMIVSGYDFLKLSKEGVNHMQVPPTKLPYGDPDKASKLYSGACWFNTNFGPKDHLMPLDMDDVVSSKINNCVVPGESTTLTVGYLNVWGKAYLQKDFHRRNGSSHILSYDYVKKEMEKPFHPHFLFHRDFPEEDFILCRYPYVLQRVGHGENLYFVKKRPFKNIAKYLFSTKLDPNEYL